MGKRGRGEEGRGGHGGGMGDDWGAYAWARRRTPRAVRDLARKGIEGGGKDRGEVCSEVMVVRRWYGLV